MTLILWFKRDLRISDHPALARAAERLSQAQMQRIWNSASEFLAGEPAGQDTDVRFDVALVDGQGCIRIIENALNF